MGECEVCGDESELVDGLCESCEEHEDDEDHTGWSEEDDEHAALLADEDEGPDEEEDRDAPQEGEFFSEARRERIMDWGD
jgi:hypothetical protein